MLVQRSARCLLLGWLWQPAAGWLRVAMLYLVAGVLGVRLAVTAKDWWPLLLVGPSVLAATACLLIALDRRR